MDSYETSFSGRILERGFWLYVWRIAETTRTVWYVGRTGDSSSANAASPFGRLSQHLDLRPSATASMLANNLRIAGIQPVDCEYKLLAVGPLFPEQDTFDDHKPYRDIVGLLEAELAFNMSQQNLAIIGSHPKRGNYDRVLFDEVLIKVNEFVANN